MSLKSKQLMLLDSSLGRMLPDALYLRWMFRLQLGERLHLNHPRSFNEKLQWLKIHDRDPRHTVMVDKYEVKDVVSKLIGERYVVPLLAVWNTADEVDFDLLPESFVIKCTHNSGGVYVVRDKSKADFQSIRGGLKKALSENFYLPLREWPYRDLRPRIIAEACLDGVINDYKFFCFNGEPRYMYIATGREEERTCFDFFDMDFKHLDVRNGYPNAPVCPVKPLCWDEMKELAARLSVGMPHVRVDFYELDGRVYFGEFTFFHFGGLMPFVPSAFDYEMGKCLELPVL